MSQNTQDGTQGHDHYFPVLSHAFPYMLDAPPMEIRAAAALLLDPEPDFIADGSSFAVVVRPRWRLYLSQASAARLNSPHVTRTR